MKLYCMLSYAVGLLRKICFGCSNCPTTFLTFNESTRATASMAIRSRQTGATNAHLRKTMLQYLKPSEWSPEFFGASSDVRACLDHRIHVFPTYDCGRSKYKFMSCIKQKMLLKMMAYRSTLNCELHVANHILAIKSLSQCVLPFGLNPLL